MTIELAKLESDVKALKEQYLRALAEFDNFRRRKEKEFSEFRELANEKLLHDLIQALDNFQRAMASAESASANGAPESQVSAQMEGLKKGIRLIYQQVMDALALHGLQVYSCVGEQFDPRRAEAVGFKECDELPENSVVSESAQGYLCRNRVLRPAMVVVAKKPAREQSTTKTTKDAVKSDEERSTTKTTKDAPSEHDEATADEGKRGVN